MSTGLGMPGGSIALETPRTRPERDRWFFTGMSLAALLTVFVGFARSYYLGGLYGARPLSTLVHVHGALFTSWILLFLTQTSLVAARRTDLHRRLGVVGGVTAVLLVVVGVLTAVAAARRGMTPPGGPPPLMFLAVPLGAILSFAILAGLSLYYRRRSAIHKRLMLLATIAVLAPAFARMTFIGGGGVPVVFWGTVVFVLACVAYDRAVHRRVHPAFLWGGLFLVLWLPVRGMIGRTDAWVSIAQWLVR